MKMKKLLRTVALFTLTALMLTSFFGCGTSDNQSNSDQSQSGATNSSDTLSAKQLRFLSTWNETHDNAKLLMSLTDDYKKQNPNLTIEMEVVPSDSLNKQVKVYIASGDTPDLFSYDSGAPLLELINGNAVVNIETEFTKMGIMDVFDEGAISLLKKLVDDKGLYALPMGMNLEGIWYNKKIFSDNNLQVPTTWDQLLEVCKTLKSNNIQPFAAGGKDKWPLTRYINAYVMRKMGVDAMGKASKGELSYTDPGFVEAADQLSEMAKAGYFGEGVNTVDNAAATLMFLTGKVAMMYNGSWMLADLNNPDKNQLGEDVGFFSVPTVNGGVGTLSDYSVNCGTILAIGQQKYDDTTADWLKFVYTRIGDRAITDFGALKGYKINNMPDNLPHYTKMVTDEFKKIKTAGLWFEAPFDDKTGTVAKDTAQLLFLGNMSGQEYFSHIQESTEEYLKANK